MPKSTQRSSQPQHRRVPAYWEKARELSSHTHHRRSNRRSRVLGYDYEDVILETRREAEEVLNRMEDLIDSYGVVSVADLYDLVGISGNYTDNKYGWMNLRSAGIERTRDGYMLLLPKVKPL